MLIKNRKLENEKRLRKLDLSMITRGMRNLIYLLSFFLITQPALAELSFCEGVWTNQSCENGEEKSLTETTRKPQSPEQKTDSLKKSILHEMTMDRVEARRKYGVLVSGQSAELVCQDSKSSAKECQDAASQYNTRLQQSVSNALKAKELEAKKLKTEKEEAKQENNSTVVIVRPERKSPANFDYQYRGPERVIQQSGTSVNVSGRSSGGRISGGISINNQITRGNTVRARRPRPSSRIITAPSNNRAKNTGANLIDSRPKKAKPSVAVER